MLWPDARVEDADDDALTRGALAAQLLPDGWRADELGCHVRLDVLQRVSLDADDVPETRELSELARRHEHRDAPVNEVVGMRYARARRDSPGRPLECAKLPIDVAEVASRGRGAQAELATRHPRIRRREAPHRASVRDERS